MSDNLQVKKPIVGAAAPQAGLDQVIAYVKSKPMIPLIAAGAVTIALIGGALMWASGPDYRVMYSNISDADGGSIIEELQKRNIPYKLSSSGNAILVPSDQVNGLRLQLAEQGLPKGGNVGFELMDNQSFGISQFAEHINFQRGLEGELTRSIESLGPVAKARVHLVMPKNSVFARERESASASVVLNLHSGRELGAGQVEAIKYMIASSVPHLPAEAVTVVDHSGRLLSKPGSTGQNLDGTQLNYIDEVESSYQRRIETILAPIVGAQNVKAQVVAQIDFATREQTAERYSPNQPPNEAAVRSQQLTESYSGSGDMARGVPGALTNSPPNAPAITTPNGGKVVKDADKNKAIGKEESVAEEMTVEKAAGQNGTLNRDKTINYEVDRNIEHTRQNTGGVLRLSAAVVVNYRDTVDEDGEPKQVPLTKEEMDSIQKLVRQAMGFSEKRGDEVAVINSPFNVNKEVIEERAFWKTPEFFSLMSAFFRYMIVAFIGLVLWLVVVRPLMRNQKEKSAMAQAKVKEEIARERASLDGTAIIVEEGDVPIPFRRKKLNYEHNLNGFVEMAKSDPRLVASVIHSWINK